MSDLRGPFAANVRPDDEAVITSPATGQLVPQSSCRPFNAALECPERSVTLSARNVGRGHTAVGDGAGAHEVVAQGERLDRHAVAIFALPGWAPAKRGATEVGDAIEKRPHHAGRGSIHQPRTYWFRLVRLRASARALPSSAMARRR